MPAFDAVIMVLSLLIGHLALSSSFRLLPSYTHTSTALYGYIPPELDPEYRNVVKTPMKSPFLNKITISNPTSLAGNVTDYTTLPVPKDGDIVLYSNKWKEKSIGRIRYLQYIEQHSCFYADIIPLKEKADKVSTHALYTIPTAI